MYEMLTVLMFIEKYMHIERKGECSDGKGYKHNHNRVEEKKFNVLIKH